MTRTVAPPNLSTKTLDQFLGMARDRSGTEQGYREFRMLQNVDNNLLESLKPRLGSAKYAGLTDASGAAVQAGMTYTAPDGTERYIKVADGKLKAIISNVWTDIGAAVFADVKTWLAQMNAQKTGASADATGTVSSADASSVTDSSATLTVNAHVGKIISVNGEKKVITSNTGTQIFVAERFDSTPTGTYNIYPRQQEAYIATGSQFYKADPAAASPALTQLDNNNHSTTFTGIVTHDSRLWGWKGPRLYWSDIGNGENFSRNGWKDLTGDIQCACDFGDVLVAYEKKRVTAKFGTNPDQFFWKTALTGYGTVAPKSVAIHPAGIQFFLDENLGVMVLSLSDLSPDDSELEPVSCSQNFINSLLLNNTAADLANASGGCDGTNYYLRVGTSVYTLHVTASLLARKSFGVNSWIWSVRTYPSAILPNSIFRYGTAVCFGGGTNGQVYEVNKAGQYTDDGTSIDMLIQKCDWNVNETQSDKSYDSLKVIQEMGGAGILNYTFARGGSTFSGTPDAIVDLSAGGDRDQEIKYPSNPSDARGKLDSGYSTSFQIGATVSAAMAEIEQIELQYLIGIIS